MMLIEYPAIPDSESVAVFQTSVNEAVENIFADGVVTLRPVGAVVSTVKEKFGAEVFLPLLSKALKTTLYVFEVASVQAPENVKFVVGEATFVVLQLATGTPELFWISMS
jgi:hypothetical protein